MDLLTEFCSDECRNSFRRALRNVPSKSFIRVKNGRLVLFIRPVNLLVFGKSLNDNGLENCAPTKAILREMDRNQERFIRFIHEEI